MNDKLIIQCVLANTGINNSSELLLTFLKEQLPKCEFRKKILKPGTIVNLALDWDFIAHAADILAIASAIWYAYEKFIVPVRTKKDNVFLFMQIRTETKESFQIILNEDYDKATFIKEVTENIEVKFSHSQKM